MNPDLPLHVCARCGRQYTAPVPWGAWRWTLCRLCFSDVRRRGFGTNISDTAKAWLANEIELASVWRRKSWAFPEEKKP